MNGFPLQIPSTAVFIQAAQTHLALADFGEQALGKRGWTLLRSYGRVITGPNVGRYVNALPIAEIRRIVGALVAGKEVHVHLMHKHVSGCYESSRLRLVDGRLVMVYRNRQELA
jgi:hypothetical protein